MNTFYGKRLIKENKCQNKLNKIKDSPICFLFAPMNDVTKFVNSIILGLFLLPFVGAILGDPLDALQAIIEKPVEILIWLLAILIPITTVIAVYNKPKYAFFRRHKNYIATYNACWAVIFLFNVGGAFGSHPIALGILDAVFSLFLVFACLWNFIVLLLLNNEKF